MAPIIYSIYNCMKPKTESALNALEMERCRRSAHFFIFDSGRLLTKDEHDVENPVKPFPQDHYLRVILDFLLVSGRLIKPDQALWALKFGYSVEFLDQLYASGIVMIEKSRQILGTWVVAAYLLWRAKFRSHQLILIQSKREEDAANIVFNKELTSGRISFMEYHLPRHLQTVPMPKGCSFGHLHFPNGSHLWAIPEGGDIIRSNTSSVVAADEAAFQPEFGNSFTAALPAIKGGGQYIGLSSAEPGEFQSLVEAA